MTLTLRVCESDPSVSESERRRDHAEPTKKRPPTRFPPELARRSQFVAKRVSSSPRGDGAKQTGTARHSFTHVASKACFAPGHIMDTINGVPSFRPGVTSRFLVTAFRRFTPRPHHGHH
jgi:hypothetical protein